MTAPVRQLTWEQFEGLLAEAYRRQGYTVIAGPHPGPDDDVDFVLKRRGETRLVQCKQWRTRRVGATAVREMLDLVAAYPVSGGVLTTSGTFTRGARAVAEGQPVQLVDGEGLSDMIGRVLVRPNPSAGTPRPASGSPACQQA
ncbi:MAG: restriction endonuclease [Coriobacteriia bacterium]|nr:restriction endonuclease [Coriobacteriia bacterium]